MVILKKKVTLQRKRRRMSSNQSEDNIPAMETFLWAFLNENMDIIMNVIMKSMEWKEKTAHVENTFAEIKELQEENVDLKKRLSITEGRLRRAETAVNSLQEKVVDLTSRSMRDNLIFKNIPEERDEDLESKLKDIIMNEIKVRKEDMADVIIERVHRIGIYSQDRQRHVVAKFNPKGKDIIAKNLTNLNRNSQIKISDQHPPEIQSGRNKLWPIYKNAKDEGKKPQWVKDQVRIGTQLIKPPTDRICDINQDTTGQATQVRIKHTAVVTEDGSHF